MPTEQEEQSCVSISVVVGVWSTRGIAWLALVLAIAALIVPLIGYVASRPRLRLRVENATNLQVGMLLEISWTNDGSRSVLIRDWNVIRPNEHGYSWHSLRQPESSIHRGESSGLGPNSTRRFKVLLQHNVVLPEEGPFELEDSWADVELIVWHHPFFFWGVVQKTHRSSLAAWDPKYQDPLGLRGAGGLHE